MRINATTNCFRKECDSYQPVPLEVTKSLNVDKTNTLHQFDTASIIGIESPVGKVPIVFYIKENSEGGRRGIIYFDDYDSVCWMYPESEHAQWCSQPYDIKYDALVPWSNEIEHGYERNWGILELWYTVLRHWYNGQVMYRPRLKIQGCGHDNDGYPGKSTVNVVEEKRKSATPVRRRANKNKVNHSCGCRKGA